MSNDPFLRRDPNVLSIFTVYDHPRDFPDCFVVRRFDTALGVCAPSPYFRTGATLDEVRNMLPPGLVMMHRQADDDPAIVEIWI